MIPTRKDHSGMSWSARSAIERRLRLLANDPSPAAVRRLAQIYFERLPADPPLTIARRRQVIESGAYQLTRPTSFKKPNTAERITA